MEFFQVKKFIPHSELYRFEVPASKSLLNRALILSAFSNGTVKLLCGSFAEDTRVLLRCLSSLGIQTKLESGSITVHGCGGIIPKPDAEVNVGSAGTAARFLTVALAFCGGNYKITSSAQMEKRPMEILKILERHGVLFEFLKEPYHFPFYMKSNGITDSQFEVDTDKSTQYASGILLAAATVKNPCSLLLKGSRTEGSYVHLTLDLMERFGAKIRKEGDQIAVYPIQTPPSEYEIEPDISGACYFYALSLLFGIKVWVNRVRTDCKQGDMRFLKLLEDRGVRFSQTTEGLLADGSGISSYAGFHENMNDYSDQALTVSVLAAFASSPSRLTGIGHIRLQECDRIRAICENLNELGAFAESDGNSVTITPRPLIEGTVKTFDDHRVAMSFALAGLKTGKVAIENPSCCKKTFENYFDVITKLTQT